jgi:NADPH:quinone reductase
LGLSMRAAVLRAPRTFEVTTVVRPAPGAGQVLVRVTGCGVCGSSSPVFEGRPWFEYPRPAGEPGHESWGEVVEVGEGIDPRLRGRPVACLGDGGYAEYLTVDAARAVPLPAGLGSDFPGEAVGCAINAFHRAGVEPHHTVAVVGVGFLGALLLQLAGATARWTVALSRREYARAVSERCGADAVVDPGDPRAAIERVRELTDGQGCDVVFEAAGLQETLDLATGLTAVRGRLVIVGFHQDGPRQVDMQTWNWRGLDVVNAHERDPEVYVRGIAEAAAAVADGTLRLEPLLTRFSLEETQEAFEALVERPEGFLKAVVVP